MNNKVMTKSEKFVFELELIAEREYESTPDLFRTPMLSEYIIYKLKEELKKAADKDVIKELEKEIYGFEHLEARTFAVNHPEVSEEELLKDLIENAEFTADEANKFAEEVRTYRSL